ncbi:MAG: TlpA disulfide reductase family protein [Tenuifilaceae bacterium]|nr:TlpA disulfide reductase family protein [Tenuifilaceae bacterium]
MQSRLIKILVLFIAALTPAIVNGQVTLLGNAPTYSNQTITFYRYADLITNTEEVLAKCEVNDKGVFQCKLEIDEIAYVYSILGIYRTYLFVEPGKTYRIVLPEYEPKTEAQRLNPFFREIDVHMGIEQMEPNDLNYLISSFDLAFNENFDQIVREAYAGVESTSADSLTARLEKKYSKYNHPFFEAYRTYRYGLLKQLALMQQSRSISQVYFANKPILYNNPSYMELFNLLYDKYFLFFSHSGNESDVYGNITDEHSYTKLKQTLARDNVLTNDTLMEMVILKGLHDGFFDDKFSRKALLSILDSLYRRTTIPEHLMIAENIRSKVTRLLAGFVPAPFELYSIDGKLMSLNEFKGKYVYLNFCTTTSYSCLQEFSLLEKLYEKHKQRLEIVTISVDMDINDLKNFLEQTEYHWTFLHYGNKPEIIKDFDVRAYPTYFLIGPDRRLILSPAPSPRENFEIQFFNYLRSIGEI